MRHVVKVTVHYSDGTHEDYFDGKTQPAAMPVQYIPTERLCPLCGVNLGSPNGYVCRQDDCPTALRAH